MAADLHNSLEEKTPTIHVVVSGASGRMGRAIIESLLGWEELELSAALEKDGHSILGHDVGIMIGRGQWGIDLSSNLHEAVSGGDVVIDFSYPEGTLAMLREVVKQEKSMVIGTTGFTVKENAEIQESAKKVAIVQSSNMSVGVNLMFKLIADTAKILGEGYDIEICEIHHRMKKDAPSGTAIRMGEVAAAARKTTLSESGRFTRHGNIGRRVRGEIGIQTLRGGDVVGEHTVTFAGTGERIELTHRAHNRKIFARGALIAARWITDKKPGLYDMMDVLNLK